MKASFVAWVIVLGLVSTPVLADSVVIDFEDVRSPTGSMFVGDTYTSMHGFTLTAISAFRVVGESALNWSGSAALNNDSFDDDKITTLTQTNGNPFTLTSIDLAELCLGFGICPSGAPSVTFTGNLFGGGTVTQTFTLDGIEETSRPFLALETFSFRSDFTNLTSVTWSQVVPFHQFDNIVVDGMGSAPGPINPVPEPAILADTKTDTVENSGIDPSAQVVENERVGT